MVKIFADTSDLKEIIELDKNPLVKGFTCNPTLMRKAGVKNYKTFALDVLQATRKPVSFEVLADDYDGMERQAEEIASWDDIANVYVKIPITNTKGYYNLGLIENLSIKGILLNITAITTLKQVKDLRFVTKWFDGDFISVFAGRIADTGVDPTFVIKDILDELSNISCEVIWASPREVFNIYQATEIDCHIITCTPDLIRKYEALRGKDLTEYSLDTVKQFYNDGKEAGLTL
jgi:transaldolase